MAHETPRDAHNNTDDWVLPKQTCKSKECKSQWIIQDQLGRVDDESSYCEVNYSEYRASENAYFPSPPKSQPKNRHHSDVDGTVLGQTEEAVDDEAKGSCQRHKDNYFCECLGR